MLATLTTLDVNIDNGETVSKDIATTQTTYPFNSFCRFGGNVLAAGTSGLALVRGAANFAGSPINAFFETFSSELGSDGNKRLRFLYLLVETEGTLKVIFTVDKVVTKTLTIVPDDTGQQFIKVPVGRDAAGASWSFRVENVGGCWFAVKKLSVLPIKLSRGRRVMR